MGVIIDTGEGSQALGLESSWLTALQAEFSKPYMRSLKVFLDSQKAAGKTVLPPESSIFNAFNSTPFEKVKIVILGQDPYHGPGQAHGLCFSVPPGLRFPPSLRNIFKEIEQDLGVPVPPHGCLQSWAEQGVLLLNATLTVEQSKAASHQGKGWETFTDRVIELLSAEREGLVFFLWGGYAQKKATLIDSAKHLVLTSPHPSPLSAYRGFFGNRHFSKANAWLERRGQTPIQWALR